MGVERIALAVIISATMACGSRSALRITGEGGAGGADGGRGGTDGGGGVGPSGPGGGGGCQNGIVVEETRSFFTMEDHVARNPQLVATSRDGDQMTVVVRADEDPPIIDSSSSLTQVTFNPWNSMSEPLGTEVFLLTGATATVVPKRPTDGLSFFASYATFIASGAAFALAADTSVPAPMAYDFPHQPQQSRPGFMTPSLTSGDTWGYGTIDTVGPARGGVGILETTTTSFTGVSCGPSSIAIDGVSTAAGFIAATWETCTSLTPELKTFVFDDSGALQFESTHSAQPANIERIHLLPRDDGDLWLIYQVQGQALFADHLAFNGVAVDTPRSVLDAQVLAAAGNRIGVTAVGNGFAIVYVDPGGEDLPGGLGMRLHDAFGNLTSTELLEWPGTPRDPDPVSVYPSPDRRALLIAWASDDAVGGVRGDAQTYVTRIACLPAL